MFTSITGAAVKINYRRTFVSDPHKVGFYLRMGMQITGERLSEMGRRLPLMVMEIQVTL